MILDVHLAPYPDPVARLRRTEGGLRLEATPGGPTISLSFGDARIAEGSVLEAFLSNLLAERPEILGRQVRHVGCAPDDLLRLLAEGGQDRMGALVFRPSGAPPPRLHGDPADPSHYEEIAAEEIPLLLQDLRRHGGLPEGTPDPSPLGGLQPKTAVALRAGRLLRPAGAGLSPSTHVLKVSRARPAEAARMEHLATDLAARCGLPVVRTALLAFGADGRSTNDPGHAAIAGILVERFDRRTGPDGGVERIHQEDAAQALGLHAREKYAHAEGLPADRRYGARRLGRDLLPRLRDPARARLDLLRLVLFSLAVGNWDFHAKNLAVLHDGPAPRLAPFYDLDPVALDPDVSDRLAMPVGRAERLDDLRPDDLEAFVSDLGETGDPAPLLAAGAETLRGVAAWAGQARGPGPKRLADLAARNLRRLEAVLGCDLGVPDRDLPAARGGGWALD